MTKPLIGLTGHKGAGKDTVAGFLVKHFDYTRMAWAEALKREVYDAIGRPLLHSIWINDPNAELSFSALRECQSFERWLQFVDAHKHDSPDSEYGWVRPLLQFWGTEYRRKLCGSDYWTRQLDLAPGAVVTDCRFPDEVEAIRNAGGIMWRIECPGRDGDGHESETHVDSLPVAYIISCEFGNLEKLERLTVEAFAVTLEALLVQEMFNA